MNRMTYYRARPGAGGNEISGPSMHSMRSREPLSYRGAADVTSAYKQDVQVNLLVWTVQLRTLHRAATVPKNSKYGPARPNAPRQWVP